MNIVVYGKWAAKKGMYIIKEIEKTRLHVVTVFVHFAGLNIAEDTGRNTHTKKEENNKHTTYKVVQYKYIIWPYDSGDK